MSYEYKMDDGVCKLIIQLLVNEDRAIEVYVLAIRGHDRERHEDDLVCEAILRVVLVHSRVMFGIL